MSLWRCPFDPCDRRFSDKEAMESHMLSEHVEIEESTPKIKVAISSASSEMDDSSVESLAERVPSREVPNVSSIIDYLSMPENPLSVFGQLSRDLILRITGTKSLCEVTTLVIKDVGFSQFKTSEKLNLGELKRIEELNLSDNYLQDLSGLSALLTLRMLYLDSNQIHSISPLASLVNLQLLSISHNFIKSVRTLPSFTELREINLNHNHLVSETEVLEALQRQPKLENVSLEGNPFMKRDRHMHYKLIGKLQLHNLDSEEVTQLDYSIAQSISVGNRGGMESRQRRVSISESMTSNKAAQMQERLKDEILRDPLFKRIITELKIKAGSKFDEQLTGLVSLAVRRVNRE